MSRKLTDEPDKELKPILDGSLPETYQDLLQKGEKLAVMDEDVDDWVSINEEDPG